MLKIQVNSCFPATYVFFKTQCKHAIEQHTWTLTQTLPPPGPNYLQLSSWAAVGGRWFGPAGTPNVAGGGPTSGRCPASLGSYYPNTRCCQPRAAPWTWLRQALPKSGCSPCKANTTNKNTGCTSVSTKCLARVRNETENLDRIREEHQERLLFFQPRDYPGTNEEVGHTGAVPSGRTESEVCVSTASRGREI